MSIEQPSINTTLPQPLGEQKNVMLKPDDWPNPDPNINYALPNYILDSVFSPFEKKEHYDYFNEKLYRRAFVFALIKSQTEIFTKLFEKNNNLNPNHVDRVNQDPLNAKMFSTIRRLTSAVYYAFNEYEKHIITNNPSGGSRKKRRKKHRKSSKNTKSR